MKDNAVIYDYDNYRKLLEDFYTRQKAAAPDLVSYRYLAKRAGFASSNFLLLIIQGKRNLGLQGQRQIEKLLELDKRERQFFACLVSFNQANDPKEKDDAYRKMLAFREYREPRHLSIDHYDYFAKWHYPVIREMVNLPEFREDSSWIAKTICPAITPDEAREALASLQNLGLLTRNDQGKLKQTDQNLTTAREVASTALLTFHQSMIEHGKMSLARPAGTREVSGLTLSLSQKQFQEIKSRIHALHQDVQALLANAPDEAVEMVCQLNMQFFRICT